MPFTSILPKPLIPVMGIACIDYAFDLLRVAGVNEAVVNVHAHSQKMINHIASYSQKNKNFKTYISDESKMLLGSAGGFRKALHYFQTPQAVPFFGMNADVICDVDLNALAARHQELKNRHGVVMTMAAITLPESQGEYAELICDAKTGLVSGLGKKQKGVSFFTGVAVYEPEAFAHLQAEQVSDYVPEVLNYWLNQKKVAFFEVNAAASKWLDIGTPVLWWQAHEALKSSFKERVFTGGMSEPWPGFYKYGSAPTLQNLLGKSGIQLDTFVYELPL